MTTKQSNTSAHAGDETKELHSEDDDQLLALSPLAAPRISTTCRSGSHVMPVPVFDALPDELLSHVLDYLSSLSLLRLLARPVSRTFTTLLKRHTRIVDIDFYSSGIDDELQQLYSGSRSLTNIKKHFLPIVKILRNFDSFASLTLNGFGAVIGDIEAQPLLERHGQSVLALSLSNNNLIAPIVQSPSLMSLDFSSNRRLLSPVFECPRLVELNLSKTFMNDLDLCKSFVCEPMLRVLRLNSCKNIQSLPLSLPCIQILDLSNTGVIDDTVTRLTSEISTLEVLFMNECSLLRSPVIQSPSLLVLSCKGCESLRSPVLRCPKLVELDLTNTAVNDAVVVESLSSLPRLTALSLRQCDAIDSPALSIDLVSLTSLDLSLSTVVTRGMRTFVEHCPNLQSLQFCQCPKVVDPLIPSPVIRLDDTADSTHIDDRNDLFRLDQLLNLNVRSNSISDEFLRKILHGTPSLARLQASNCVNLTGIGHQCQSLLHVDFTACSLTDASLTLLFDSCPSLVTGIFDHCNTLVKPVVSHLSVQELKFNFCRAVDALTVSDCPMLVELDLSSNLNLSTVSIDIQKCLSLKVIHCRHLNQLVVQTLTDSVPAFSESVELRTQTLLTPDTMAYKPARHAPIPMARRTLAPPPRRAPVSQARTQTTAGSSESPTPSPSSAVSLSASPYLALSSPSSGASQPDHRVRSSPRTIERRRTANNQDNGRDEKSPIGSPSPSTRSPVQSRYLSSSPSKHRHTLSQSISPSSTPTRRSRLHHTMQAPLSHSTSTGSGGGTGEPLSPTHRIPHHLLTFSSSTPAIPLISPVMSRSLSVSADSASHSPKQLPSTLAPRLIQSNSQPAADVTVASPSSSLSSLIRARKATRNDMNATQPTVSETVEQSSPVTEELSGSLILPPPRLDRSSSLSEVDHLPRYFLNSIEIYIIQSHIDDIQHKLGEHDRAMAAKRARAGAVVSQSTEALVLSPAVQYGLKRQLAMLKARLKKEERLIEAVSDEANHALAAPAIVSASVAAASGGDSGPRDRLGSQ